MPRGAATALLSLLLFVSALAWFWLTLDRTFHLTDEGYLLRMGQRVAQGELPHVDFIEDYGPGVFVAIGALWRVGDGEILFVRQAVAVWKALAVVLAFLLTRRLAPTPVAFGVGLLSIVYWGRASLNVAAPHAALMTVPLCMASALALVLAMQSRADATPAAKRERQRKGLIVLAGVCGGLAVLFKQSLGVMNAYGLGLALVAIAMSGLDPALGQAGSARAAAWSRRLMLAVWGVLAGLLLVPGLRYLGGVDYAIHFLPIHAWMACVALACLRRSSTTPVWPLLRNRLVPLAFGAAIPLGLAVAVQLQHGQLSDLLVGMFERPLRRRNYAIPSFLPPASITLFVTGALLCLAGACARLSRPRLQPLVAALLFVSGGLCTAVAVWAVPYANPHLYTVRVLLRSATAFDWVLHSATLLGAAAVFGPRLVAGALHTNELDTGRRALQAILPLAFFSGMLCFQIYPRGAHNVWLVQAAWMPLLGITLHEVFHRCVGDASRSRRVALASLLVLIPAWLAWPVMAQSWQLYRAPHRALALPHAEGMQVALSSIDDWHLDDVEALVARLRLERPGPMLLIGGDAMLYVVADRPVLRPEHEYAVQNVVLDMLPSQELAAFDDGAWVAVLEAEPDAVVVLVRDPAGQRVLAALPRLKRHIELDYKVEQRFGRYQLFERRDANRRVPK